MTRKSFKRIGSLVFFIGLITLLVDLHEDINILGLYDQFHPLAVMLLWLGFCYIIVRPDSE